MIQGQVKTNYIKPDYSGFNQGIVNHSPATEAAGLLIRIALGLLFIVTPSLAFVSRKVVVLLVPISLAMLVIANTVIAEDLSIFSRVKKTMSRIVGLVAFTLALWSAASLLWTPFPSEAGEHLAKALGTFILAFAACHSLPINMRSSNLHLITVGVVAASLMSICVTATILAGYRLVSPEGPTIARACVMLALITWPAIAWLKTGAKYWQIAALLALVAGAVLSSGSNLALLTFATGLAVFCVACRVPRLTAWLLVTAVVAVIIGLPVLAVLVKAIPDGYMYLLSSKSVQALQAWGSLIEAKPLHMLTGYGFETSISARYSGILIAGIIPRSVVDLWYDLGFIGAFSVITLVSIIILKCLKLPKTMIAAALAEIAAASVFSVSSNTVMQIWFLSSLAIASVAFMAVKNGQHRMLRPKTGHAKPIPA